MNERAVEDSEKQFARLSTGSGVRGGMESNVSEDCFA